MPARSDAGSGGATCFGAVGARERSCAATSPAETNSAHANANTIIIASSSVDFVAPRRNPPGGADEEKEPIIWLPVIVHATRLEIVSNNLVLV
jgi:hypothetical protein